jgi:2-dehydropantoate 2-reductase
VVISLQNGVRNPAVLRAALPAHRVLAGMVPFNVIRRGPGALHRASDGVVRIDADPAAAPLVRACRRSGVACEARADMVAVHWGKLVLNLNNAINALSGLPLADQLGRRPYRRCLAAAQREALAVLARARVPVARVTALPPGWIPPLLGTPDRVFRVLGRRVVAIDPAARSSMWDDLEARRPTEIDYLQGEIIELAARCGMRAPVNSALAALVRAAEAGGRRDLSGPELLAALALTP